MGRAKAAVVMAAGLGTRMKSSVVKVLHPVAGQPMIRYAVDHALALGVDRVVLVLGHQRAEVEADLRGAFPDAPLEIAVQAEQLGTAHAVLCAQAALADFDGDVFILSGDVPTLPVEVLRRLHAEAGDATAALVSMTLPDPAAYGRIVRANNSVVGIVEARDCTPQQRLINEVNAGIYRFDARFLFKTLATLGTDNAQGEYYLTDVIARAHEAGHAVHAEVLEGDAAADAGGVNDRIDLAAAEARMQHRLREALMVAGVTLVAPETVRVGLHVSVGQDTVIEPGVALLGRTTIGEGAVIEQGARIEDGQIAAGARIRAYTCIERAIVGPDCVVGPMARLREGTELSASVKIGNFVETKKAHFGVGAKASHLSYLGDASIGARANIGAGTITCNYDGVNKFRTVVGSDAFIGSDTQLVAPVVVGDGAFVGAGSTVTNEVPAGALTLSRVRQKNIEGWVERKRARDAALKKD